MTTDVRSKSFWSNFPTTLTQLWDNSEKCLRQLYTFLDIFETILGQHWDNFLTTMKQFSEQILHCMRKTLRQLWDIFNYRHMAHRASLWWSTCLPFQLNLSAKFLLVLYRSVWPCEVLGCLFLSVALFSKLCPLL